MEEDRISELPEHILQNHVLSLLSQKTAVRTSVLSKSWRHLGLTRPKFEFQGDTFSESKEKFISVVDNTLQRYVDQKLSIQEFVLGIRSDDPQNYKNSISLLDKWIPVVLMNLGVKTLKLRAFCFSLPSVVFQAEFLEELYLEGCKLDQINNCIVNLQALKSLELYGIYFEEGTFEKIISSCPLIEHLVLEQCRGLSTTKVNKAPDDFTYFASFYSNEQGFEINDAPNLETISISGTRDRYHLHSNFFFPRLKSLILSFVTLPTDLLNNLSLNCPSLEVLELHYCPGLIRESKLSNPSIKRLVISTVHSECPFKAVIDVPNMLHFEFNSTYIPSISFATTSREWKSVIDVGSFTDPKADWWAYNRFHLDPNADVWPLKLHEFLKALSQSRISSLTMRHLPLMTNQDTYDGGSCDPVVVDRLSLEALYSSSEIPAFLNCLFRICRPRNIALSLPTILPNDIQKVTKEILETCDRLRKENESQLAESIWKILEKKGGTGECNFWQQDLEKSSIHVLDMKTNAWHRVQAVCALSINQSICFLCCWNKKCMSEVGTKR